MIMNQNTTYLNLQLCSKSAVTKMGLHVRNKGIDILPDFAMRFQVTQERFFIVKL